MRIVCWQEKLGKMSQNLLSVAVVIGALRVNTYFSHILSGLVWVSKCLQRLSADDKSPLVGKVIEAHLSV